MNFKKWISNDEANNYRNCPIGGLGGFFNWKEKGMRWKDYLDIWHPEVHPYLEAIRESVLNNKIRYTGQYHQNGSNGVPLFEDNSVALFSFRGWGDLMAAIWGEEEDKDYSYMDFYMDL